MPEKIGKWTVARFPNGTWATGGNASDPDYGGCEIWIIDAPDRETAKRRAQGRRAALNSRLKKLTNGGAK